MTCITPWPNAQGASCYTVYALSEA